MNTVTSVDDIRNNLETMRGCLFGSNERGLRDARYLLERGRNLVAGSLKGIKVFGPSRFMGYTGNYPERHFRRLPRNRRDAFRGRHPDASDTDKAIDKVRHRIKSRHPDWKRLEGLFRELCDDLDVTPETRKRTYWDLDDDSGFVDLDRSYAEGRRFPAVVMRAERSAAARAACIRAHRNDPSCVVCGFNFAAFYGELGEGFIHIHHLDPVANGETEVCPETDLVPVCANCHCMLHRGELLAPEDLEGMMLKKPCSCARPTR